MKKEIGIFIGGLGGQGAILAGNILGKVAVEYMGLYATMEASYTSQTMGGPSKSEVKISREPIIYPFLETIDYLVALNTWPLSNRRVLSMIHEDTIIIYDSSIILDIPKNITAKELVGVPFSEIANELGNTRAVNMVAIGVLLNYIEDYIKIKAVEEVIKEFFSDKVAEINIKALRKGYEYKL